MNAFSIDCDEHKIILHKKIVRHIPRTIYDDFNFAMGWRKYFLPLHWLAHSS